MGGNLAMAVANIERSVDLEFVWKVILTNQRKNSKTARALIRENSYLIKSKHAIPQSPHSLIDQKQSHMFKFENGLTVAYIFYFHNWST